jgi:hypothetical protein
MKTLWTFGDSYTADYSKDGEVFKSFIPYQNFKNGTLPEVWPTLLGRKLQTNVNNMASGGSSNTNIFLKFIDVCEQLSQGDIVIIGWSNNKRFIGANFVTNQLINILPCDTDFTECNLSKNTIEELFYNRTHPIWLREIYGWIKIINGYCDLKNVKIYHWSSDVDLSRHFNETNDEKHIKVPGGYSDLMHYISDHYFNLTGLGCRIIDETNGLIKDGHFGEYGHIAQSEYLYKHLSR